MEQARVATISTSQLKTTATPARRAVIKKKTTNVQLTTESHQLCSQPEIIDLVAGDNNENNNNAAPSVTALACMIHTPSVQAHRTQYENGCGVQPMDISPEKVARVLDMNVEESVIDASEYEEDDEEEDEEVEENNDELVPVKDATSLMKVKSVVLKQLSQLHVPSTHVPLVGIADQRRTVFELMESTLRNKERKSFVLTGPHSSGKTLVVRHCLQELYEMKQKKRSRRAQQQQQQQHQRRCRDPYQSTKWYTVVCISGLHINNDRDALIAIVSQLYNSSNDSMDDNVNDKNNNAYVSRRALLKKIRDGEFDSDDSMVIQMLLSAQKRSGKCVFLIVDWFEIILAKASKTLYNLLDGFHSFDVAAAIIGTTTQSEIIERTEKRIRSRFDQLLIQFFDYTREEITDILEQLLTVRELPPPPSPATATTTTSVTNSEDGKEQQEKDNAFVEKWNQAVTRSLRDTQVQRLIASACHCDRNLTFFINAVKNVVLSLEEAGSMKQEEEEEGALCFLSPEKLRTALSSFTSDSRMRIVKDLSMVEQTMLMCMKRVEERKLETYTFERVYSEYLSVATGNNLTSASTHENNVHNENDQFGERFALYPRELALTAFEHLVRLKLARPTSRSAAVLSNTSKLEHLSVRLFTHPSELSLYVTANRSAFHPNVRRL